MPSIHELANKKYQFLNDNIENKDIITLYSKGKETIVVVNKWYHHEILFHISGSITLTLKIY